MIIQIKKVGKMEVASLLLAIEEQSFNRPFDVPEGSKGEELKYLEYCEVYMAYDGEKAIGFIALEEREDHVVEVKTLAVYPTYQHHHIGKELLGKALSLFPGHVYHLYVHPQNEQALQLYGKSGFKAIGRVENYFGDGQPRVIMERKGEV